MPTNNAASLLKVAGLLHTEGGLSYVHPKKTNSIDKGEFR